MKMKTKRKIKTKIKRKSVAFVIYKWPSSVIDCQLSIAWPGSAIVF